MTLLIFVFPLLKQTKKKLGGLTREHEALFNFVENNKQMCTEKEKQKAKLLFTSNTCSIRGVNTSWKCCLRLMRFFLLLFTTDVEQADQVSRVADAGG